MGLGWVIAAIIIAILIVALLYAYDRYQIQAKIDRGCKLVGYASGGQSVWRCPNPNNSR
ncbi:MAG TPA: hypothetical protein VKA09_08850 [Nitrososphaeraceae archaeon]|nr:hypothetical protein [Nitrososphaeraceae archaeon]